MMVVQWSALRLLAPTIRVQFTLAAKFISINVLYHEKTKINEKETGNGPSFLKKSIPIVYLCSLALMHLPTVQVRVYEVLK